MNIKDIDITRIYICFQKQKTRLQNQASKLVFFLIWQNSQLWPNTQRIHNQFTGYCYLIRHNFLKSFLKMKLNAIWLSFCCPFDDRIFFQRNEHFLFMFILLWYLPFLKTRLIMCISSAIQNERIGISLHVYLTKNR